jgi:hypothetical protein
MSGYREDMQSRQQRNLVMGIGVLLESGLGLLALLLGWLMGPPALASFRWDWRDAGLGLTASFPLLAVFLVCVRWPVGPLAGIKRFSDEFIRPLFAPCTVLDLALLALLAGVGEELLFRGVLQPACAHWLGDWPAILATSALFGILHLVTPAYGVMAAAMSVYLGWVCLERGNVLVVIVAHGFYDFVALLFLVRGARPLEDASLLEPPLPQG